MNKMAKLLCQLISAVSQHYGLLVCLVSLMYFGVAFVLASKKVFWNDELFTFYISRLSTFREVWASLLTGAEQLPPLFYIITRAFARVFGWGYVGLRLPEMVGFWVMSLSLYRFVSRRSSKAYGLIAMIFPLTTESLSYSVEARPYGLVLGLGGAALVFWQMATEGQHRAASLAGFGLSLAAAISCHYYAILMFFPFAIGEAVRFAIRRKLDLSLAVALGLGLAPLAVYLPLIQSARAYSGTFWAKPQWSNMVGFYQYLLNPTLLLLLSIPLVLALGERFCAPKSKPTNSPSPGHKPWEMAAAAGFALIPILAVFMAKTITGAFANRYALPAVIGIAILLAWSAAIVARNSTAVGLVIAGVATVIFLLTGARELSYNTGFAAELRGQFSALEKSSKGGSALIVVANPQRFLEFSHLAGEHGAPWLAYLADSHLALQNTGTDDVELGLLHLEAWAPLHVERFEGFVGRRHEFAIIDDSLPFSWVVRELSGRGWKISLGQGRLLTASPPNR